VSVVPAPDIVVFDLDGTLANVEHRLHLIDGTFQGWHRYNCACIDDTLYSNVAEVAKALNIAGCLFWVVTGRAIEMEAATRWWFHAYCLVPDRIIMRPIADERPNAELKRSWLQDGTIPRARVLCVFDDDPSAVTMWRAEGLTCFQVGRERSRLDDLHFEADILS
jgi:hypothetical protein